MITLAVGEGKYLLLNKKKASWLISWVILLYFSVGMNGIPYGLAYTEGNAKP